MEDSLVNNLQDRMRWESRRVMVRVCYRSLIQSEGKEEAFFKHLEEVSGSQTLVPCGGL